MTGTPSTADRSDKGPLAPRDGGWFGRWVTGADGAPEFAFAFEPTAGGAAVLPRLGASDCWHAVANAAITATAHAGGWTTIYATSRGMVKLTGSKSRWGLAGRAPSDTDATFIAGAARWRRRFGATVVTRRLAAPVDGAGVLRIEIAIEDAEAGDVYEEQWIAEPRALLIGALMSKNESPPPGYGFKEQAAWRGLYALSSVVRAATNAARLAVAPTLLGDATVDHHRRAIVFPARRRIDDVAADSPAWFDRAGGRTGSERRRPRSPSRRRS